MYPACIFCVMFLLEQALSLFEWVNICMSGFQHHHQKLFNSSTTRGGGEVPGKAVDDAQWAEVTSVVAHSPSLFTTPTALNESRWSKPFTLLVLACLWWNEWSGTSMRAHYLVTEPALCRGRLSSSDNTGMLPVWCHLRTYSEKKEMHLMFEF